MNDIYHNVIGIDLGTTYSAVATFNKFSENTEILRTESGDVSIPSVVSYDRIKKKAYAGMRAKNIYRVDPDNTIIEIKREMGEVVNERNINEFKKLGLDPKINEDPYRVKFADEMYLPQEIIAFILLEVKKVAEDELGETINDAVITVPAYFTEKQKKATEEAALLAGLYPRQLIPEPTAAAICYGVDEGESEQMTYLVYDLGGGIFDVSIIEVEDGNIAVLATSGDSRLGGSDFDDALTSWVLEELKSKHQIEDVDNKNIAEIKAEAEKAKMILSDYNDASIDLSFIGSPDISSIKITRDKFEELVDPLLRKSLNKVDEAIQFAFEDKGVSKESIDNILLVGGSTKIPKVKTMLLEYFGKSDDFVSAEANPDTVVARGAAIMAKKFEATPGDFDVKRRSEATLMSDDTDGIPDSVGLINEHTLSVELPNELVSVIIERGRNLPASQTKGFIVNTGPSTHIPVTIFQGESKYAYENTLIGTLNIGPLEPKPAGEHKFEVTFNISENGLLDMTIFHLNENKSYTSSIGQKTGVGGDDKLKIRGLRIIDMFWHASGKETDQATATDSEDKSGAIPPPSSEGTIPPPATHETQPSMPDQEGEYVDFEEVKETQEESRKVTSSELSSKLKVEMQKEDEIDCSVYCPDKIKQGQSLLVQAFVHLIEKSEEAEKMAKEFDKDAVRRGFTSLNTFIRRGEKLSFELSFKGINLVDATQTLIWQGRTNSVEFELNIPEYFSPGNLIGKIIISKDSIPLGHIRFKIEVIGKSHQDSLNELSRPNGFAKKYEKAFISYASQDRSQVNRRVQMLNAAGIQYFQDLLNLEPGDKWADQIYKHIDDSDVFFLFWSKAACNSDWVLRELRYALKRKGGIEDLPPEIIPVPIEKPIPNPPEELKDIHFNDKILYFIDN